MIAEEWRPVAGHELYEVSSLETTQASVAELFGVTQATVSKIYRGERWKCLVD